MSQSQNDPTLNNEEEQVNEPTHQVETRQTGDSEKKEQVVTSTGLTENVAGLLCYVLGFVTGIIFLIIEKENRFVRFHAYQSIFVSVVYLILSWFIGYITMIGWLLSLLLSPAALILWIFLLLKAYQGQLFKLPVIGDFAEKQLNS